MTTSNPFRSTLKYYALACAAGAVLTAGSAHAAPPGNDNFAAAIALPGDNGVLSGNTNLDATFEVDEPVCKYQETTNTVWFKWVCAEAGSFTLATTGSLDAAADEWDAVVCVYTGASLANLTQLKAEDIPGDEIVTLKTSPGTYYFQLGGYAPPSPGKVATDIKLTWSFVAQPMVDISGTLSQVLDTVVGAGNAAWLTANAETFWEPTTSVSNVYLNGFQFSIDTGNGNPQFYNGTISGPGVLRLRGNTDATWVPDIHLGGSTANSPDSVTVVQGRVQLDKTAGIDALAGPITVATSGTARIQLLKNDQINDASVINSTTSSGMFHFDLGGFSETISGLDLGTGDLVNTGVGGILKVTTLVVDGIEMPKGAYTSNHAFVTGSGYIDVDDFGPPVIADLPGTPASPTPADAADNVHADALSKLTWAVASDTASYDVYLWLASETKPESPTAAEVLLTEYTLGSQVLSLETYNWQVVAKNAVGDTEGPVWTFSTLDRRDISGGLQQALDAVVGAGPARLVANAQTYWVTTTAAADVNLSGFQFTIDTGDGNQQTYNGAISGPGTLRLQGKPDGSSDPGIRLGGTVANTPDAVSISKGRVQLNKAAGVDALAGPITVSTPYTVVIQLLQSDQINDASVIDASASSGTLHLELGGFSDTIGGLVLKSGHTVKTGGGGVLTTRTLTFDGVPMTAGTYTSDSAFITGSGSVVVTSGGAAATYADWTATNAGGQAPGEDYDLDGVMNGIEFFMGATGSSCTQLPTVVTVGDVRTVTWTRDPAVSVPFKIQVSDDLSEWTDVVPPDASIDESIPTQVTYTLPSTATVHFCRLVVSP